MLPCSHAPMLPCSLPCSYSVCSLFPCSYVSYAPLFPCSRIRQRFFSINQKKPPPHLLLLHHSLLAANRRKSSILPTLATLPSLVHAWQGTCQTITSPEWAAAALNIGRSGGSREKLSVASHFPLHLPFPTPTKGTFQRHLDLNGGCWLQPDTKQSPIAIHEDPVCTTPARDRFPGPRSRCIRQLTVWR
jgi:hypothetical protein